MDIKALAHDSRNYIEIKDINISNAQFTHKVNVYELEMDLVRNAIIPVQRSTDEYMLGWDQKSQKQRLELLEKLLDDALNLQRDKPLSNREFKKIINEVIQCVYEEERKADNFQLGNFSDLALGKVTQSEVKAKVLAKEGLKKGAKSAADYVAEEALSSVPFIGSVIAVKNAALNFKENENVQGALCLGQAVASACPGPGTAISAGLSAIKVAHTVAKKGYEH